MESDNKQNPPSRRTSTEIIDLIYNALPVESKINIAELSRQAGLDWSTTKRHLELILHIQEKQKGDWLIEEVIQGQPQPAYGRKRK